MDDSRHMTIRLYDRVIIPIYLIYPQRRILIARVAQSVERSAVNRKVGGSNPPVSDIFLQSKKLSVIINFFKTIIKYKRKQYV